MKIIAIATALYIGLAKAAPAIVWNSVSSSSDGGSPLHISDLTDARSLLTSTLNNGNNDNASNLSAVIFLVGRDADGSEGLNAMAASGKLPQVQAKQASASSIHYHVDGVESSRTMAKDAAAATLSEDGEEMNVVEVALEEFNRKLDSLAQSEAASAPIEGGEQQQEEKITKSEQKRRRAISDADILVVTLTDKDNAASIDSSIVKAIDSKLVQNVILSSIRSTDEVKHARRKLVIDKITKSARPSAERRRRLQDEDGQNNQNNNNNNNNQYQEGVYYVNMTPNIFSGLLFFFMFVFTAHLGLTCMNMIEGQDVYVKKYPTIGREV
ncbi:hypothetical protein ACHAWC_003639 [Mediolabrus comicus]